MIRKLNILALSMSMGATLSLIHACAGQGSGGVGPTKRDSRSTTNASQNATQVSGNMVISKVVVSDADAANSSSKSDDPNNGSPNKRSDAGPAPTPTPISTSGFHCNAATISFAKAAQCPAGNAVIAIDDGTPNTFACCPVSDPGLFAAGAPTSRQAACFPDEIIVGGAANGNVLCGKIDTTKYAVGTAVPLCYFSLTSTSSTGANCVTPSNWLMNSTPQAFGSDGCYMPSNASVLVRTQGVATATCQNFSGAPIISKATGQQAAIFVP